MKKATFQIATKGPCGKVVYMTLTGWEEDLRAKNRTVTVCYDSRQEGWWATEQSTGFSIVSGQPTRAEAHRKVFALIDRVAAALDRME